VQAEAISRAKRHDASLGLPGVITLYELPCAEAAAAPAALAAAASAVSGAPAAAPRDAARFRAILDGQHRVGALRLLARNADAADAASQSASSSSPWSRVLVEVYPLASEAEAEALFTEINSAQPVMLVDLPQRAGGAPVADKGALEGAATALAGKRMPHARQHGQHACARGAALTAPACASLCVAMRVRVVSALSGDVQAVRRVQGAARERGRAARQALPGAQGLAETCATCAATMGADAS
jgi:hypothetical protein